MRIFLEQLFRSGQITVPPTGAAWEFDGEAERWVLEFDRAARLAMPGTAPALEFAAAAWAAQRLAEACRLAIARDAGAEEIERAFSQRGPSERSAATDYSVDLFFRHLPDLLAWARRVSANDPLVAALRRLAEEWPLSSVGIAEIAPRAIDSFIGDAALRRLYADRIVARRDAARLADTRAAEAVRAALGAHAELAPGLQPSASSSSSSQS